MKINIRRPLKALIAGSSGPSRTDPVIFSIPKNFFFFKFHFSFP